MSLISFKSLDNSTCFVDDDNFRLINSFHRSHDINNYNYQG
jgi:hypothetical protein